MRPHRGLGRSKSIALPKMEVDLSTAGECTGARTYDPRVEWCTRNPKKPERKTPGAARPEVAAAPQASAQAKLSWRQHDAPDTGLVCFADGATHGSGENLQGLRASS
jgi:hypothetical protein